MQHINIKLNHFYLLHIFHFLHGIVAFPCCIQGYLTIPQQEQVTLLDKWLNIERKLFSFHFELLWPSQSLKKDLIKYVIAMRENLWEKQKAPFHRDSNYGVKACFILSPHPWPPNELLSLLYVKGKKAHSKTIEVTFKIVLSNKLLVTSCHVGIPL